MKRHLRLISVLTAYVLVWGSMPTVWAKDRKAAPIMAMVGFFTQEGTVERQARSYLAIGAGDSGKVRLVPAKVVKKQVQEMRRLEQKEALKSLTQAYQEFAKGKKLYDRLEIDPAIARFSKAVRGYREGIAALHENRYLLASHLYLGMSLVIRGRAKEGSEYIKQMVILNPWRDKQKLPTREFPPKIVQLHQKLTKQVVNGPSGKVVLRSSPPGAVVYFDGVQQPPTPVDIDKVPVGEHFVTMEKAGFRRFSTRVEVKKGEKRVPAVLEKWDPLAPQRFEHRNDPDEIAYLTELGELLGARILVLGDVESKKNGRMGLRVQLFDTHSREFSKIEQREVSRGRIKRGATKLSQDMLNNLSVTGGVVTWLNPGHEIPGLDQSTIDQKTALQQPAFGKEKRLYEKWWFWTIVGAVAIGAGTGTYLLISQKDPEYHILSVSNPFFP